MGYDYDALYGSTPDALGEPTKVFVDFFDGLNRRKLRVLDVGCGQGRDALFIARAGHNVVGVDLSENGIDALYASAMRENLNIQGIVADIETFTPDGEFDVVLIHRTLHMLDKPARLAVLERLCPPRQLAHRTSQRWHSFCAAQSALGDYVWNGAPNQVFHI